ncbi:hypothetical protein TMEN_9712 [Trichophyton mentagrophytes]|nr:hypothetical protein TMEN_9712 [Trichophyton mentagrophytes]
MKSTLLYSATFACLASFALANPLANTNAGISRRDTAAAMGALKACSGERKNEDRCSGKRLESCCLRFPGQNPVWSLYTDQSLCVAKIETGSAAPKTKMVLVDWMLQEAWDEMIADSVSLGNVRLEEPKVFWIIFAVDELSVIKTPTEGEENAEELRVEREILERLGDHPRIVKLLYTYRSVSSLNGSDTSYDFERGNLREDGRTASYGDILKWSAQAAEGMQYFHAKGVLQVDIGLHNLLVDWDDNVKYCDFSGSSIDGSRPTVVVSPTAQHPKACCCSSLHFCYIPGHRQ